MQVEGNDASSGRVERPISIDRGNGIPGGSGHARRRASDLFYLPEGVAVRVDVRVVDGLKLHGHGVLDLRLLVHVHDCAALLEPVGLGPQDLHRGALLRADPRLLRLLRLLRRRLLLGRLLLLHAAVLPLLGLLRGGLLLRRALRRHRLALGLRLGLQALEEPVHHLHLLRLELLHALGWDCHLPTPLVDALRHVPLGLPAHEVLVLLGVVLEAASHQEVMRLVVELHHPRGPGPSARARAGRAPPPAPAAAAGSAAPL
mmetsp:Transcript_2698/g.8112  ORF Transcript_2698/g.8112 Transcript_2698/m.8112 type:complete len:259 (-) Transcript_2698:48-824(-)